MKTTARYFAFYFLLALSVSGFAHGQKTAKNKDLPNFYKVNANLYRGGQPKENGVRQLSQMGVKTIINLRGDDDLAKKEEKWATDAGMRFINVSLSNWFEPKDTDIEKIVALINQTENQPVFIHCKRGSDRTGTVIAVYRMTHDGWTAKQANEEAKKFGFGWWQFWMKDYINDYYEKMQKEQSQEKTVSALLENS